MKQVFYTGATLTGEVIELDDVLAHHIFDVLRTSEKERIRVVADNGVFMAKTIQKPCLEILEEIEDTSKGQPELTLCFALIKADKFEWMLQKAAEIGAKRIVPFTSARTIVQIEPKKEEKKRARWASILEQACRQSNRTDLVELAPVCTLAKLKDYAGDISVMAYEKEDTSRGLYGELSRDWNSATFVIGPEGGFAPEEAERLAKDGFVRCSLGANILRAETAACFVLSAAQYQYQINQTNNRYMAKARVEAAEIEEEVCA